jgi:hypothetical protein
LGDRLPLYWQSFFLLHLLEQQPPVGQGLSFTRFLDHTQRRTTVGRTPLDKWSVRRRERPLPDNTHHSQQTSIHAPGGIRAHNLSKRAAVDLRFRPRGHWDRQWQSYLLLFGGFRPQNISIIMLCGTP